MPSKKSKGAKKKSKKSKKSKSKSSSSSSSSSKASLAADASTGSGTPAFNAGQLFERYSRNNMLGHAEFQRLVESENFKPQAAAALVKDAQKKEQDFEVGRLFERFSRTVPGHVTQQEFGGLVRSFAANKMMRAESSAPPPAAAQAGTPGTRPLDPTSYAASLQAATAAGASSVIANTGAPPRALQDLRQAWPQGVNPPPNKTGVASAPQGKAPKAQGTSGSGSTFLGKVPPLASTELHILSMNMMSRRDSLVQQMRVVQGRIEEVRSVRRAIERETIADTEAVLHRLRSAEALKLSLLDHDMNQLQHDIDEIDTFIKGLNGEGPLSMSMGDISASARGQYLDTCAEAERISRKPLVPTSDVRADDFERETADRLAVVEQFAAMRQSLDVKERMIWKLLQEQKLEKERQEEAREKLDVFIERSQDELSQWVDQCKQLTMELTTAHRRIAELEGVEGNSTQRSAMMFDGAQEN